MSGSLLSIPYPDEQEWRDLVTQFSSKAIAHKLLLAHIPYVFREEPLKYSLFRRTIGDAFEVEPSNVFIVGSAMAGRSLKGDSIGNEYSSASDIDTLIISDTLFTSYVMDSMEWLRDTTKPDYNSAQITSPTIQPENTKHVHWLSDGAHKGIWRPDSLPDGASAKSDFFDRFASVSLKTLGLQLSEDTVAKVNGRIARTFEHAVEDLSNSIYRLSKDLTKESTKKSKK